MDDHIKDLAAAALRSAFWQDFRALLVTYRLAAAGLGTDVYRPQIGEMPGAHNGSTDEDAAEVILNIWTQNGPGKFATTGHDTLRDALEYAPATEVHLRGQKIFERRGGVWHAVARPGATPGA